MTPQAIRQLQTSLGLPATGIFDTATQNAMTTAITKSLSTNPTVKAYAGSNDPAAILSAYQSGDWSNVVSLSGKPFTDEQQKAAVDQATTALAPAYKAQQEYDTANTEDALKADQENYADFEQGQTRQFGLDKTALDQNAANNGVLFSGSRLQKQNDLRTTYAEKEAQARRDAAERIGGTTRDYQYNYGDGAVGSLKDFYSLPNSPTYDAGVAGGKVTQSPTISSVYNPGSYNFQGTKPVAQQTAIQTRAASSLANRANKLSLSGVGAKL